MHTRPMVKQSSQQEPEDTTPPLPGTSSEPDFLQPPSSEYSLEPADAGSPNRRRRANAPDVEDALTQMIQTLQGLQQQQSELAQQHQAPQALQPDVPEDPTYDWDRLRLPVATSFPVPCTGRVQRMASDCQLSPEGTKRRPHSSST